MTALKGAAEIVSPIQGWVISPYLPKALPWAGLLPGLWPCPTDALLNMHDALRALSAHKNDDTRIRVLLTGYFVNLHAALRR
jgi:hypothetical protein